MIRVLPNDYYFYFIEGAVVECVKDELCWWVDGARRIFVAYKFRQLSEIGLFKLLAQLIFPAIFNLYVHCYLKYLD